MILTQIPTDKEKQQISVENSCFDCLSIHLYTINGEIRSNTFNDLVGHVFPSILNFVFAFEAFCSTRTISPGSKLLHLILLSICLFYLSFLLLVLFYRPIEACFAVFAHMIRWLMLKYLGFELPSSILMGNIRCFPYIRKYRLNPIALEQVQVDI